ncbi:hypothetical protein [Streptomyces sp. NPDC048584]
MRVGVRRTASVTVATANCRGGPAITLTAVRDPVGRTDVRPPS